MIKKLLFTLLVLVSFNGFSQNLPLSEQAKVSILTCGTSPESYAMYGHTGIRIQDKVTGLDVVYNYGAFDFSTPNFIGRFIKGDLQYFITNESYIDFYYNYQAENRAIIEQELALTPIQVKQLFEQLNTSVYSDDQSYRELLYPYMSDFYMKLGIQIIFGTKVDEPASRLFLPYEFESALSKTKVNGVSLEKSNTTVLNAQPTSVPFNWLNSIYSLIGVLLLLALFGKKWIPIIYFTMAGLLGLFFSLVGLYSLHEELLWNYNILLFNPLFLIYAWYYWKENKSKTILLGKIILGCLALYLVYMLTKIHLGIVWPFIVLHSYWLLKNVLKKN